MVTNVLAGVVAVALAMNIGANNSAAEMGPAYGAGVQSQRRAVLIIAIFCALGAIVAGHRVMDTVGHGLVGAEVLAHNPRSALIISLSALILIALANIIRLPLATSHAVVGAVVGFGLFSRSVNEPLVISVLLWWVATPLASLLISAAVGRSLYPRLARWVSQLPSERLATAVVFWAVTLASCWMAFAAGSNSLAKAMGPAVGAGVFQPARAAVIGGLAMALGAALLGGRMIRAVGKEITPICPICAFLIQAISASIVFTASRFGRPVSLAEIVTCSVIGFGWAASGFRHTSRNHHVRRILVLWPAAPVLSAAAAFALAAIR
jgi:sulfate permease